MQYIHKYKRMIDKLLILYRILHLYYNLNIKDIPTFLRYLYTLDSIRLRDILTPYIWEDYIFIDEKIFKILTSQNNRPFEEKEFDKICEFDREVIKTIIKDNLVIDWDVNTIDHEEYLPTDEEGALSYYSESRENYFLIFPIYDGVSFKRDITYESDLRERRINKIIQ